MSTAKNLVTLPKFGILALVLIAAVLAASVGIVFALSNTVTVPGGAGLPGNLIGSDGSAPVDSGLDLSSVSAIEITASGFTGRVGSGTDYANGCCFVAQFVNDVGDPIDLPPEYPAVRTADFDVLPGTPLAFPPSWFYPIVPTAISSVPPNTFFSTGAEGEYTSGPLPIPAGAVAIRYGTLDSGYGDNVGSLTVTTTTITLDEKVDVCHKKGKKNREKTINISKDSLEDHLAHGDTKGPCS